MRGAHGWSARKGAPETARIRYKPRHKKHSVMLVIQMYDYLTAMMGPWSLPRREIGRTEAPFAAKKTERRPAREGARELLMPSAQIALIANLSAAR